MADDRQPKTDDLRHMTPEEMFEWLARLKAWANDAYLTWLAEQAKGPQN